MKLLLCPLRRNVFLLSVISFLAGAQFAFSQRVVSNIWVTITQPTNGAMFLGPTNLGITAVTVDPSNDMAYVSFSATPAPAPGYTGPLPTYSLELGTVSNGVSVGANSNLYSLVWSNAPAAVWNWTIAADAMRSNGCIGRCRRRACRATSPEFSQFRTSPAGLAVGRSRMAWRWSWSRKGGLQHWG
jgi:hypothetical protein